jgi:hypothetical protein
VTDPLLQFLVRFVPLLHAKQADETGRLLDVVQGVLLVNDVLLFNHLISQDGVIDFGAIADTLNASDMPTVVLFEMPTSSDLWTNIETSVVYLQKVGFDFGM